MTATVIDLKQSGGRVCSPVIVDPADYDNDTDYLNAIPGMAEPIIESMNAPMSEFEDVTEALPDEIDIDPADYPDTTAYLNAIPGMAESLIELMNAPASEFKPAPRHLFHV